MTNQTQTDQMSYYMAFINGRPTYMTTDRTEVPISTLPAGVENTPKDPREAWAAIKEISEDEARSKDAAKSMTREQLNYLTAIAKGMEKYDNGQNVAVTTADTLPQGIEKAPTKEEAFQQIELAANGGHGAAMMKMGDLTRKERKGLPDPDQAKSAEWLTNSHKALQATINNPNADATAEQLADANWDMSAVHYYNSTLKDNAAKLPLPEGIKTSDEADLYYTTLAARPKTNHRYGEWVERVLEGTEYKMDAGRKAEIMGMANAADMLTPRFYGSGKENLGEAHNYAPYVSTAQSRADMLESWSKGDTNPADRLPSKKESEKVDPNDPNRKPEKEFTPEKQEKLDKLRNAKPETPMRAIDQIEGRTPAPETKEQGPKPMFANFNVPSAGADVGVA